MSGTQKLTSERLILRPLQESDTAMMFYNWASDPRVTKYLTWPAHESIEMTKESLKIRQPWYQQPDYYDWGIVLKENGELIGTVSVVNQDQHVKLMEFGFCIGHDWWGNGYTPEAVKLVIAYLFQNSDVNRIEIIHDRRNVNSGKVIKKCGLTYEGTLRQRGLNTSGVCDEAIYSLLREDYCK
ncbi:GNAT family N-acetyltransferase [Fructilactobacillus carniphilus]|uniref:GNAT family N-acetyltransferase n=1 Tax=Fructilactobacillus carniphilus TaxID=2940297 RepID=A0ABY5BVW0_9LACO|nr:GNAT family N-acetyltransferase [Fructilactobacillus carniphilus]USS90477.1 GNAT family N-acetyltransferase [Fructilactobacillus carniphilus]